MSSVMLTMMAGAGSHDVNVPDVTGTVELKFNSLSQSTRRINISQSLSELVKAIRAETPLDGAKDIGLAYHIG